MNTNIYIPLAFITFVIIVMIIIFSLKSEQSFKQSETTLLNIYGQPLKPCRKNKRDSRGSWDSKGFCSEKGGGVHQICFQINDNTKNFSTATGQTNWSESRNGRTHCMCLGAWSLYKARQDRNQIDKTNNELICDAIPQMSLTKGYINNWNTWNGYELPDQIVKGVNYMVDQCYDSPQSSLNGRKSLLKSYFALTSDMNEFTQTDIFKKLKLKLYKDFRQNYSSFMPSYNRNAAGHVFFKNIYDKFKNNEALFDIYNEFYCPVSGSVVVPRERNFNIIGVPDLEGKEIRGRYYRCCTPCPCDVMRFVKVITADIGFSKPKHLLTIADPCSNKAELEKIQEIDKSHVFKCENGVLKNGLRVTDDGKLTDEGGRLVIGVLHKLRPNDDKSDRFSETCVERNSTPVEKLRFGMGDIFAKVSSIK